MEFNVYLDTLDQALEQLRAQSLGQMTPLRDVLPCGALAAPRAAAKQVAQMLVLQIGQFHPLDDFEIQAYLQWLFVVCRFILTCPEEDHTFLSILKISKLESEVRRTLLAEFDTIPDIPPTMASRLEEAIWRLTKPTICISLT